MSTAKPVRQAIKRLYKIRGQFGLHTDTEKLTLLESLRKQKIPTASDLRRLHETLCFVRAFPDSREHYRRAVALLNDFGTNVGALTRTERDKLDDSGIVGTPVFYCFSYEVASWMGRCFPGFISIDWAELDDTSRLDELVEHLLEHSEADYFDSGWVTSEEWLAIATSNHSCTDFDWLLAQLKGQRRFTRFWTAFYNASELPLRCDLNDAKLSKSGNTFKASRRHKDS